MRKRKKVNIVVESREIVECPTITALENLFGLANKVKGKQNQNYIYKIINKLFVFFFFFVVAKQAFKVYAFQFQHPKKERIVTSLSFILCPIAYSSSLIYSIPLSKKKLLLCHNLVVIEMIFRWPALSSFLGLMEDYLYVHITINTIIRK